MMTSDQFRRLKRIPKNKYGAKRTKKDGINFHSKAEKNYYDHLKAKQAAGQIKFFLRQIPFDLPGGFTYRLDFMVINNDDSIEWVEVKGYMTDLAKLKIAQSEEIYKIHINVVK